MICPMYKVATRGMAPVMCYGTFESFLKDIEDMKFPFPVDAPIRGEWHAAPVSTAKVIGRLM